MLLLTLMVGWSYYLPVELITSRDAWYMACIGTELIVIITAVALCARASCIVVAICAMLEMNHINGWIFDGHVNSSPYHVVVKYLEYIELLACSLFSFPVINKMKGAFNARY